MCVNILNPKCFPPYIPSVVHELKKKKTLVWNIITVSLTHIPPSPPTDCLSSAPLCSHHLSPIFFFQPQSCPSHFHLVLFSSVFFLSEDFHFRPLIKILFSCMRHLSIFLLPILFSSRLYLFICPLLYDRETAIWIKKNDDGYKRKTWWLLC